MAFLYSGFDVIFLFSVKIYTFYNFYSVLIKKAYFVNIPKIITIQILNNLKQAQALQNYQDFSILNKSRISTFWTRTLFFWII